MFAFLVNERKKKGHTQQDIAKHCGVSVQAISAIERGKRKPSVTVAKKIAYVLNFDWTLFFKD